MNKKPVLRFNGYTEDWEQCKLGSILREFVKKSIIENEFRVLSSTNSGMEIRNGRVSGASNRGYKIIDDGDLVLSPQNLWLGNINVNNIGLGLVSPSYKTFNFVDVDMQFIEPQLREPRFLNEYRNSSTQGASVVRRNLELDLFYQIPIYIPTINEQYNIGNLFLVLGKEIALHQRELKLYETLKKTMLANLFPGQNKVKPTIRFKGFTDDWEQRKLEDVAEVIMGHSPSSNNYTDDPTDNILVQGNADMKDGRVVPRVWTTEITKMAEAKDIIFSVRAPVGDVGKTDYDVVIGRGVAAIKGNDFIFYNLVHKNDTRYWDRVSTGSTFESINSNELRSAIILLPDRAEQERIGELLKDLSNLITLHQRELDYLKNQKVYFLKMMFV